MKKATDSIAETSNLALLFAAAVNAGAALANWGNGPAGKLSACVGLGTAALGVIRVLSQR